MIRLDEKLELLRQALEIQKELNKYANISSSKKLIKLFQKSVNSDVNKGLKVINKKNPIYIEMPKLIEEGSGMYSEQSEISNCEDKIINVTTPAIVSTRQVVTTKAGDIDELSL